jgi:hypothetical protein
MTCVRFFRPQVDKESEELLIKHMPTRPMLPNLRKLLIGTWSEEMSSLVTLLLAPKIEFLSASMWPDLESAKVPFIQSIGKLCPSVRTLQLRLGSAENTIQAISDLVPGLAELEYLHVQWLTPYALTHII